MQGIDELHAVVKRLRVECPWDAAQTPQSMRPYVLEEAHEVLEAIASGDPDAIQEELGDLLFQIVLISAMFEASGEFDLDRVAAGIAAKMVRRHPHVFAQDAQGRPPADAKETIAQWEADKQRRRGPQGSILDGVPKTLPALLRAHRVGEKVAHVGFDWPDLSGVRAKIDEELAELDEALEQQDPAAIRHELGDVLLSTANLARFLELGPEDLLQDANRRFEGRFRTLEELARQGGLVLHEQSPQTLERLWEQAKALHAAAIGE